MSFLKQSALLNLLYVFEAAAGFLIDFAIVIVLGASLSSDALYAAWIIPQTIGRGLFQSLSHSLLGLFGETRAAEESADSETTAVPKTGILSASGALHRLYGQIILVMVLLGLFASVLVSQTSATWIPWTISGAAFETQGAAIVAAAILGWLPLPLALSETLRAIYYFEGRFAWPSLFRIAGLLVAGLYFMVNRADATANTIAWAILIGAIVEFLLTAIVARIMLGGSIPLSWPDSQMLRRIGTIAGVPMAGVTILMVAAAGERMLASFLGPGTITLVSYANRIVTAIERFVFRGILIAATKEALADGLKRVQHSVQVALLFALPVGLGLLLVSPFLIPIIFVRGEFTAISAQQLVVILQFYSVAIIGLALSRVPFGYVFAFNQTRHIFGFYLCTGLTLLLSEFLFYRLGMDVALFGIGYAVAMWCGFFYLWWATRDSLGFEWRTILKLPAVGNQARNDGR